MVLKIKIKRGLDIPIAGAPEQVIGGGRSLQTVAAMSTDYFGLRPRVLVEPGQAVGLGEPLFLDKRDTAVQYTAPASGRVLEVNRGRRRVLQSVVIELDETASAAKTFERVSMEDPDSIRKLLLQSGAWTSFRTRPFDRVPDSRSSPRSMFITAIDTRPLAANPRVVIESRANEFSLGMQAIAKLSEGPVFLCTGPDWTGPEAASNAIQRVEFSGPHPAGLPGTHIHCLDPVGADREVWHIDYQDVIAIGYLFKNGRLSSERIVAVGGPGAVTPRLLRTRPGANISQLMADEIASSQPCRIIAGSVLDGCAAEGPLGYLGRYDNQVSVVFQSASRQRFGWFGHGSDKLSSAGLRQFLVKRKARIDFSDDQNGRRVAMIPVEAFEQVMPLDILPAPLLRALLIRDTGAALALGCLELGEDDLALSSFVCPAKQDYAAALRASLDQIEKEG